MEASKEPAVATFNIKETGAVAHAIFCTGRLSADQLRQVLWEPSAWALPKCGRILCAESDYIHPKSWVTPQLVALEEYTRQRKDGMLQARMAVKAGQATDKEVFALDVVNGLLFSKMVNLLAALVEQAASAGDWIVVDHARTRGTIAGFGQTVEVS